MPGAIIYIFTLRASSNAQSVAHPASARNRREGTQQYLKWQRELASQTRVLSDAKLHLQAITKRDVNMGAAVDRFRLFVVRQNNTGGSLTAFLEAVTEGIVFIDVIDMFVEDYYQRGLVEEGLLENHNQTTRARRFSGGHMP